MAASPLSCPLVLAAMTALEPFSMTPMLIERFNMPMTAKSTPTLR